MGTVMGQNYRIPKILDIVFGYLITWIIFITWTCLLADASSKIPVRHEVNSSMIVSSDRNRNHANRWFRVSFVKTCFGFPLFPFMYLPNRCPFFPFSFPSLDITYFHFLFLFLLILLFLFLGTSTPFYIY